MEKLKQLFEAQKAIIIVVGSLVFLLVGSALFQVFMDNEERQEDYEPENSIIGGFIPVVPIEPPKPEPKPVVKPRPRPVVKRKPRKIEPPLRIAHLKPIIKPPNPYVLEFNRRALSFNSSEVFIDTHKDLKEADKNMAKSWKAKSDKNEYPFDLSRVVIKEKFVDSLLKNKIVSSYPGPVLLQVSQNIYGAHGNLVLIPKGSMASGQYLPLGRYGDDRLRLSIERIIKPDGDLILFEEAALGTDSQGAVGVPGEVDNRYWEKFGMPLLFNFLQGLSQAALKRLLEEASSNNSSVVVNTFNKDWFDDQSSINKAVMAEMLQEYLRLEPIITIEPGTKMRFVLAQDIVFGPNKNGIVKAKRFHPITK